MKELNTYDIYYNEEGDFLEIIFKIPPEKSYADEIEPGIFISRDEETDEIFAIGILSFKKRVEILDKLLERFNLRLPLKILA